MKNLLITPIFLIICGCLHAQIKVATADVKEILIHNAVAGLGGGTDAAVKVVFEAGRWQSYFIHKSSKIRYNGPNYDSTLNRHIATLNAALVNNFLNGLAIIKPAIVENTFGIKAAGLIAELKKNAKSPITKDPEFEKLITPEVVDAAIAKIVAPMNVFDDYESCEVTIITHNDEKIKLNTTALCATKLPWIMDNNPTYNMAINDFVVAALGKEDIPNKNSLSINSLKEAIFKYIDASQPGNPIATFKWSYYYPETLKLLNQHFMIVKRWMQGDTYSCVLRTKTMPADATLESRIDMTRKQDINRVIKYANLLDKYFNSNNFVLKYYSSCTDCHLIFACYNENSAHPSLSYLNKKLPELAKADATQVISFWTTAPDDSATWMLFPDGKSLLTYHSITTPGMTTAPIFPPHQPGDDWNTITHTYFLFDNNGTILSQGLGLY